MVEAPPSESERAGVRPAGTEPARLLVFDGDCPLCERFTVGLVRIGWISERERRAYQTFDGEQADALWNARIRNEMAVLEPATGEIRTGFDGLLWLFEGTRARVLTIPFRFPPLRAAARVVYHLVSYNRRAIAPPELPPLPEGNGDQGDTGAPAPSAVRCACDPDDHRGYQLGFTALCIVGIVAGWFAIERGMGQLLLSTLPVSSSQGDLGEVLPGLDDVSALEGVLAWMATWVGFAGLILPSGTRIRALPHLGITSFLAITPALFVGPWLPLLPDPLGRALAWTLLVATVVLPLKLWPPRARFLELEPERARSFAAPLALATLFGVFFL